MVPAGTSFDRDIELGQLTEAFALAAGDVDGDGLPDVVVGDPYRDVGGNQGTGGADVFVTRFASWTNYGPGWPGTLGIPSLVGVGAPGIGESFSIALSDSCTTPTTALLFLGFAQISIPTNKGGTLLVVPAFTIPLAVPTSGVTLTGAIPDDSALIGLQLDAQAIETDAGASKGVSFTPGLEIDLGVDW